jgi:hypothetical protein
VSVSWRDTCQFRSSREPRRHFFPLAKISSSRYGSCAIMRRRKFLNLVSAGGAYLGLAPNLISTKTLGQTAAPNPSVKRVLVVFKCHFDAGFIDTQANVVRRYFDEYFPQAIKTAESLSPSGSPRYVWTTGSWLLYEYLEQANVENRKKMEQAIHSGFIAWHALPFTWQTEMMDPTMIAGALSLSQSLDKRFGTQTTGAKMSDVPGHTRGIVAPLAAHGVSFLDIGVNEASRPAILPPIFRWKDATGATIVVMYHFSYGAVVIVPHSDLAIATIVRDDNSGPHTPEEIAQTYADLQKRFPNAQITATNLATVANAVEPYAASLPIVAQEIGDTWIHGVASDPLKVARYREVSRLRQKWLMEGKFEVGDATDIQLLRSLLLEVEHTWGTDTKTWLDFDNYIPRDLQRMLDRKNYKVVEFSWEEKRHDLYAGLNALPRNLQNEAAPVLAALVPKRLLPLSQKHTANTELETEHFVVRLDEKTGALHKLKNKASGHDWTSPENPCALFTYQTLSQKDYEQFFKDYVISTEDWAFKDFGKPGIERFGAQSQIWAPTLLETTVDGDGDSHLLQARLEILDVEAINSGRVAFPKQVFVRYAFPKAKPAIEIQVSWFGKLPTRMPEALWLSFNPLADPKSWMMRKSGQDVSPFDVAECGNRHLHGLMDSITCKDGANTLRFTTLDAPLVSVGRQSPLNFSKTQPTLQSGIHFNLFNNAWGTNYIMWYAEDSRFRFLLEA